MKKICVLSFLFVFLTSTAFAGTVNLPQTGQTKCYDWHGGDISCAGTGQDGEIQAGVKWPEPRFTDNGDGTLTDNLTSLMWAKNADLPNGPMDWSAALDFCNNLNLGGYTDWRLPNMNEVESLTNANVEGSDWPSSEGFTNVQTDWYYHSSTTVAIALNDEDFAWGYMWSVGGVMEPICKYICDGGWYQFYVWPVRGGDDDSYPALVWTTGQRIKYYTGDDGDLKKGVAWPTPRFTDNTDGTVTDNLTGLTWTKDANLPEGTEDWQQALDYVKRMNAGANSNFGYTDWRLPNRKELYSLIDHSRCSPALPLNHPFSNVQSWYWSSTTFPGSPDTAWSVSIELGKVSPDSKSECDFEEFVWPVRGGQVRSDCSNWSDVITKYNAYVSGQAVWNDVIMCYTQYTSP